MGGTEIKRSTRQSQCLGDVIVTPVGALARDCALVGSLRPALLHDEVGAGDRSVQHHGLARHGEFHGLIVAAVVAALAVAIADGLAVQAVDVSVGSDGHFLRRGRGIAGHDDVGGPIRRHTVDFLDLGIGGHGDGAATCYPGQVCVPVEHAAKDSSVVLACHTALEGSSGDHSVVV